MKIKNIFNALTKPRPVVGISVFLFVVILASLQEVEPWWSIPASFWFAETAGFIYEWIKENTK